MHEASSRNDDDAPRELSPSLKSMGFVDFPHPRSDRANVRGSSVFNGILMAAVAGVGLGILLASVSPTTRNLVSVSFVIPGVLALRWMRKRVPKEIREGIATHGDKPLEELLSELLPRQNAPILQSLEAMARELAGASHTGESCRICLPQKASPFKPIDQPFEPIPLDESDPYFFELEKLGTEPENEQTWISRKVEERGATRRMRRNLVLSGSWLFVVCFGFNVLLHAWDSWDVGRVTPKFVFFLTLFCMAVFGIGGRGAWTFWRKWSLLPGGVVVENASVFRAATTQRPFSRTGSVLIVRQSKRGLWAAHIADATRSASAQVTEREATMLLRAWLSPVPEETTQRLIAAATG